MKTKNTGFTLLEVLLVIAVMGVLAAMIFPSLGKVKIRARTAKAVSELKTIQLALMEHYSEHGGLPTNDEAPSPIKSGLYKLSEEDLLETALADAFLSTQQYTYYASDNYNGTGSTEDLADSCIVFSVGSDGSDKDRNGNDIDNFDDALNDAYPGLPLDLDRLPESDNIYLFVNVNASRTDPLLGREGDIRYKK